MKKKKEVIVEDEIKLLKEAIITDMSDGLWGLGVSKLPKFNLKKINSKEVLDLFNKFFIIFSLKLKVDRKLERLCFTIA